MKRGTPESPKTKKLCRRLGCGMAATLGHLEALWHFTARYAPRGDIGRWTNEDIAEACHWEGCRCNERGLSAVGFVEALIGERWLDADEHVRIVVHDWPEHADDAVKKALRREDQRVRNVDWKDAIPRFVEPCPPLSVRCPDSVQTAAACQSPALPEPCLALPEEESPPDGVATPTHDAAGAAPQAAGAARQAPDPAGESDVSEPSPKKKPDPPPEAVAFAKDFRESLKARAAEDQRSWKPPSSSAFAGWVDAARVMLCTHRRPEEEARALARWLFTSDDRNAEFWRPNIQSVTKFVKQYDTLAAQWKAAGSPRGGARSGSSTDPARSPRSPVAAGQRVLERHRAARGLRSTGAGS